MRRASEFRSTPPHGGRPRCHGRQYSTPGFDPRPRMEGDRVVAVEEDRMGVSIHAPAWRATPGATAANICRTAWFRSTPPHGGRHDDAVQQDVDVGFDPRPRMEGDCRTDSANEMAARFRSTPPHGGRRLARSHRRSQPRVFRSTPPHGGRRARCARPIRIGAADEFRSTPPHGGRQRAVRQ